jgi:hypothetical protein
MFDSLTGAVVYLPGVTPPIAAVSRDGSSFLFENTSTAPAELDLWSEGVIARVAQLEPSERGPQIALGPVRIAGGGSVFVFQTDAHVASDMPVPFNNSGGFQQIYRFDMSRHLLSCVSCPPAGLAPSGDAVLSNDDVTGRTSPLDSSGVSADGSEVFFDSPQPLIAQDVNGVRDVYEWHDGSLFLLTGAGSFHNSYFLDNTASGEDVFFTSADGLALSDTDGGYDVYDARVGGVAEQTPAGECESECQGPPSASSSGGVPASATYSGPGNPPLAAVPSAPRKHSVVRRHRRRARHARARSRRGRTRASRGRTGR